MSRSFSPATGLVLRARSLSRLAAGPSRRTTASTGCTAQELPRSEVRKHGEIAACRLIAEGLKREGLRPGELRSLAKGDPRKARIAAQVRSTTTVLAPVSGRSIAHGGPSFMPVVAMPQINDYSLTPARRLSASVVRFSIAAVSF
jgi:hypothetical protein